MKKEFLRLNPQVFPIHSKIMTDEYWYRALKHFEKKNYVSNGLTIPFLIGSRLIIEPANRLQTINELLMDISLSRHTVTLMKCGYINEYVLGLLDHETNSMRNSYKNMYKEFGSLLIIDNSFSNYVRLEDIIKDFENNYNDKIESQHFSKSNGQWKEFSSTSKIRLTEITEK